MERDVSIVLAGAAGQGIDTVADLMASVLKKSGYHVFVAREFMSRIRGGTNSIQLRVSSERVAAFSKRTDIMIPLNATAIPHLEKYTRISDDTIIIGEAELVEIREKSRPKCTFVVPFNDLAKEVGSRVYSNTIAAGTVLSFFDIPDIIVKSYLEKRFGDKGEEVVEDNVRAYQLGVEKGRNLQVQNDFSASIPPDKSVEKEALLSGTDAVALGAIAGGCNFISSYPMSPSTGVLTFLARHSQLFDIIVDQAESEIGAINKGLGAWYAGARAMVTTSGGGFALMTEGLSLAGMMESPMVIHLAQRPGPATGLPTRTEQGDLSFVVNAAHGEFARIVLTPGTLKEAFYLTQKAFNLADKFQVPVFILTDQFFLDSSYNTPPFDLAAATVEKHIVKTEKGYKRYKLTENGVSPRGIPGYGVGLIYADSDEHDETGHITEDLNLRPEMVEKRLHKRMELLREVAFKPTSVGNRDARVLVLTWGSNFNVAAEALRELDSKDFSLLHFSQVYPIHEEASSYLERAEDVLIIENNASSQFARVLQIETGFTIPDSNRLLKYDGMPFPVEQVKEFLEKFRR